MGEFIRFRLKLPIFNIGKPYTRDLQAVTEKPEFQVVGENQVVEGIFIAVELFFIILAVQGLADVFGFDVTQRNVGFGQDIVRRTASDMGGFVSDQDTGQHDFQQ